MFILAATTTPDWLIYAIIGGSLVLFPFEWCGVVWILSRVSGWHRLAQQYDAARRIVAGEQFSGVQGMVGRVSYRRVLTIHFADDGFFLEVSRLFRIGHPRLFIPWTALSGRKSHKVLFWKTERFDVGHPVISTITLPEDLMAGRGPAA